MKLTIRHRSAIQLLVLHQFDGFTQAQLAEKIGCCRATLQNWFADLDFRAAHREALREWRQQIEHVKFTHRRARLEELTRLYEATPDDAPDKILPDGTRQACESVEFLRKPGYRNDFMKMEGVFAEHRVLRTTTVGNAKVMNLRIRDLVRVAVQCLGKDIEFLLGA